MVVQTITHRVLLALACCLVLVLLPVAASAQGGILGQTEKGIQKGAQGVEKGVQKGVEGTKEGAEAVGHGVKKGVTGESTTTERQKSQSTTTTPSTSPTTPSTTTQTEKRTTETTKGGKRLPGTAGELPLIALIGSLALAGAVARKLVRRVE
jgi:hypothetical protein